jgi:hypothetical protein
MQVPAEQIEFKKQVGKTKEGRPVWHVKLKGGLHLMVSNKILGAAPHRGIARHLASQFDPDVEWTELSKSDWLDPSTFQHLLPEYTRLTDQLRATQEAMNGSK